MEEKLKNLWDFIGIGRRTKENLVYILQEDHKKHIAEVVIIEV